MEPLTNPLGVLLTPREFDHARLTYLRYATENPKDVKPEVQDIFDAEKRLLPPVAAIEVYRAYDWDLQKREADRISLKEKLYERPTTAQRKQNPHISHNMMEKRITAFKDYEPENLKAQAVDLEMKQSLELSLGKLGVSVAVQEPQNI